MSVLKTAALILALVVYVSISAQGPVTTTTPERCGFSLMMQKAKANGFNEQAYESLLDELIQQRKTTGAKLTTIYTIPVIFHIIHRGETLGTYPNITAAQVNAQIAQLNVDFANLAGSAYGVAADMGLRFCAAVVDTNGKLLAEPGIERLNGITRGWNNTAPMSANTVDAYFASTIKPQSIWDPRLYLNIWTADISGSNLLGWATFPGLSTLAGLDNLETDLIAGLVIEAGTVGSVANPGTTVSYQQGKTATHELGHYFGLRHIWGDANCGTDYCNDTPVQSGPTTGCPASPASNGCTPAMNKMFENYMDYSFDACMNTFTADQTTRAQTVMINSPRRVELTNSSVCLARPANSVQFKTSAVSTTETGTTGTCPVTKTITATIIVASQASGNATLTFTGGGTASNGNDYTISPASISYTAGDAADKTVTITIIDDKAAESTETIVLGYTITGTGIVAGPEKQTYTVTVVDDDYVRTINESTPTTTIFSENFNASTNLPTGWTATNSGTNVWVVSNNGGNGTTGNAAHITQNATTKPNTYDNSASSQSYITTPTIDASGLYDVTVSFKWRCKGETFQNVVYDAGYLGYILPSDPTKVYLFGTVFNEMTGNNAQTFTGILPASFNGSQFKLVFYWVNDASNGNDPGFTVDDILITGKYTGVESVAAANAQGPIYSGQNVQFISSNNDIIASLSNISENVGCVIASVQAAGTGRTAITTTSGSYFRTNKVITVVPSSSNTTATYQGTIYFKTAELSPTWSAAEIQNMKILKVKDGVSLSGTLSAADAVVVTPTFTNNSASGGYYSYTGNFTGFSQFMGVSPNFSLPVDFVSFEANAEKNSIVLNWKTASELNNKGFVIERSINASDYEKIGWMVGKGTTSNESSYQFTDRFVQPDVVYYYRLRQTDLDNKEKLSQVRQAKISGSGTELVVSPNPAYNEVRIFVKGAAEIADISLVNSIGQQTAYWKNINVAFPTTLSIQHLPKGYYQVVIHLKEGRLSSTLVIE